MYEWSRIYLLYGAKLEEAVLSYNTVRFGSHIILKVAKNKSRKKI